MAKQRKPFACPGCSKSVKVPIEHLGKRIKCPKCQFIFRAGPKQRDSEVIYAELDDDLPNFDSLIPAANVAPPAAALPALAATPRHEKSVVAPPPYRSPRIVNPPRSSKTVVMTESDSQLQSTGIFLIILPLVATVLPLFGIQLRRLARAGDYAPLAAMILGLIGVGLICYARRNQKGTAIIGSLTGAFVVGTGVGGFLLISSLASFGAKHEASEYHRKQQEQFDRNVEKSRKASEARRIQFAAESEKRQKEAAEQANKRMQQFREERERETERMNKQMRSHIEEFRNRKRRTSRTQNRSSEIKPSLPSAGEDSENPFIEEEDEPENPFKRSEDNDDT